MAKKKNNGFRYVMIAFVILMIAIVGVLIVILTKSGSQSEANKQSPVQVESGSAEEMDETDAETASITETTAVVPETSQFELRERSDSTYEEMLAATMIIAISMEYPDMEIQHIYLASECEYADSAQSEGTYICFTSEGEEKVLYSKPLEEERTGEGIKDLHSENLGYSSYDLVSADEVDSANMKEISIEDLTEQFSEALLVSIVE